MANLTIAVDDDLLRRARLRALESGTSVNALLRQYLISYAGDEAMSRRRAIVANAQRFPLDLGAAEPNERKPWTRDDLHER